MEVLGVLLDLLAERTDIPHPAPTPQQTLEALEAAGAPTELLALYRAVGDDVAGLFPPNERRLPRTLVRPQHLVRLHRHFSQQHPGTWPFALDRTLRGWALRDGRVCILHAEHNIPETEQTLQAALEARLAELRGETLVWDADADGFVVPGGRRARTLADLADPEAVASLTSHIREGLRADGEAIVAGLGRFGAFTANAERAGRVYFKADDAFRDALQHDTPNLQDPVLNALIEAIKVSSRPQPFHWSGIGTFSGTRSRAHSGRNPGTGEMIHIPASMVASFTPYPGLVRYALGGANDVVLEAAQGAAIMRALG
ncbi:MAG: HU family DNA-binding protein [Alphaproteobacteria bacterium]|nr:HU family DNA-binding protein [Alphaproteobacteria bacterium]MCB9693225.1 HU family DNA-binding protein [Alphaproteobacteria bacterium]